MPTSLVVVDDFLEDPQALRRAALSLSYPPQAGAFPGRNSVERVEIDGLTEAVSRLVGERLRPAPPPQSHAKFRITLAGDTGRAKVHIDKAHWSGVLYLSRPDDCRGGTEFFRHLPTQSDRAPMTDEELAAAGFASQEQMYREIVSKHTLDDSKWEMTMRVPMRFNRLLMLRPWMWHTAGEAFGNSLEDGRLVYLLFFEVA